MDGLGVLWLFGPPRDAVLHFGVRAHAKVVDEFLQRLDPVMRDLAANLQTREYGVDYYTTRPPSGNCDFRCVGGWYGPLRVRYFFAGSVTTCSSPPAATSWSNSWRQNRRLPPGSRATPPSRLTPWSVCVAKMPGSLPRPTGSPGRSGTARHACGTSARWPRCCVRRLEGPLPRTRFACAADGLHAAHLFCPDGGRYQLAPDGKQITCTCHGSAAAPARSRAARRRPAGSQGLKASARSCRSWTTVCGRSLTIRK